MVLIAVASMLLGACSSSSSSSTPAPAGTEGGGAGSTLALTAKDFAFSPTALTANAGSVTVTVTNDATRTHSFTLDDDSVTKDIPAGTSQEVVLDLTGTVSFHCRFHSQMVGTITVSG
ncbi:MAG: cupredoxin domain-containing protein [Actinomycetota bacterium]